MKFKYHYFSIPVISLRSINKSVEFEYNKAFENLFKNNTAIFPQEETAQLSAFEKLIHKPFIHWNGSPYMINELKESEGLSYYFLYPKNNSVALSCLWLKHDLINILNPIMGFSEILAESDDMNEEDNLLIRKIGVNSKKMFEQIQKLSALQLLTLKDKKESKGQYLINDFLLEINNKLIIEKTLQGEIKNDLKTEIYVSNRICKADFQQAFEGFLSFLARSQKTSNMEIKSVLSDKSIALNFILEDCMIYPNQIEDIQNIDKYILKNQTITSLKADTLNYLLINEISHQIGGKCSFYTDGNRIVFHIELPIQNSSNKAQDFKSIDSPHANTNNDFHFSVELQEELKKLFSNFDGLMVLDKWETFNSELEIINARFQNANLEQHIKNLKDAIQSFDVDSLKNFYHKCQSIFNPHS